jgi:hypothetical protein
LPKEKKNYKCWHKVYHPTKWLQLFIVLLKKKEGKCHCMGYSSFGVFIKHVFLFWEVNFVATLAASLHRNEILLGIEIQNHEEL